MLNGLDLFSGIGGLSLALQDWVCPIAYCESDRYAQSVLLSRMERLQLPVAPIWDDVRSLKAENIPEDIDIIYGGFPCQDRSLAGPRIGLGGKRSKLFWEIIRLTVECSPIFVFVENPRGVNQKQDVVRIRSAFAGIGYKCRDGYLSAKEVGANHERCRWFVLAYSEKLRLQGEPATQHQIKAQKMRLLSSRSIECQGEENWAREPKVDRMANGVPCRMDISRALRMDISRALGNAVVPLQAREAFKVAWTSLEPWAMQWYRSKQGKPSKD